jgi:hypothetical protein
MKHIFFFRAVNLLSGKFNFTKVFNFTSYTSNASINSDIIPVKLYSNASIQKQDILKENKGLSGIYRWVNNENGKSYIGSAVNLYARFIEHFNGYKSNIILQQSFDKYKL